MGFANACLVLVVNVFLARRRKKGAQGIVCLVLLKRVNKFFSKLLIFLIKGYQRLILPLFGPHCGFNQPVHVMG